MTRLQQHQVIDIPPMLIKYDLELEEITGASLKEIACRGADISGADLDQWLHCLKIAVVPVTTGQGIISGFTEAVAGIIAYLGGNVFITKGYDVAGLAEGIEKGAQVIFIADDNRFVAINLPLGKVVDNSDATARGYVTALEFLVKGLLGREVLVIGGGIIGKKAIKVLLEKGALPVVYDVDETKLKHLKIEKRIKIVNNLDKALQENNYIFEATPADNIISAEHIKPNMAIAAPGIPLGLTNEAYELARKKIIHDPLQLGAATMLAMVIKER
ncbi:MAG: 3-methylornithyl-N6-L-lysine dehydrogenase PylD [Clostridia bacterium]|jgi:pyrrolysine biosynthesis protein PylD|nr:3-methylornithyl-N6-L-lysine dehydrogenase PylD [Clostridia bacterium]